MASPNSKKGGAKASNVLNPLSTPKGQKFECELCGRVALLQCRHCRVTYYCGKDHMNLDWVGIHEKICQLLVPLRSQPLIIGSEEERVRLQANMQKSQRALIDLTRMEATKFLVHGNYEHAIPGAVQALRFSLEVFGPGRIELVPCHLLLAEANLGLGRQKQAEEYLSLANWSILKNPDCSNRLKSQLYRNFGKLYASQGKYEEALRQLANDIYFSSLQVGPDHVDTAGGFYYLATVFYLQKRVDCALAMCDKVVDIWYKHCSKYVLGKSHEKTSAKPNDAVSEVLGDAQVMEGLQILSKIVTLREEALGIDHVSAGEACYTLALLYQYAKDISKARTLMKRALTVYRRELGDEHPSSLEVMDALEAIGYSRVPSRSSTALGIPNAQADFNEADEVEEASKVIANAIPENNPRSARSERYPEAEELQQHQQEQEQFEQEEEERQQQEQQQQEQQEQEQQGEEHQQQGEEEGGNEEPAANEEQQPPAEEGTIASPDPANSEAVQEDEPIQSPEPVQSSTEEPIQSPTEEQVQAADDSTLDTSEQPAPAEESNAE